MLAAVVLDAIGRGRAAPLASSEVFDAGAEDMVRVVKEFGLKVLSPSERIPSTSQRNVVVRGSSTRQPRAGVCDWRLHLRAIRTAARPRRRALSRSVLQAASREHAAADRLATSCNRAVLPHTALQSVVSGWGFGQ